MCITTTSASPSRNPCTLCAIDDRTATYRDWERALREASTDGSVFRDLCMVHKEEVVEWEEAEEMVDDEDPGLDGPYVYEDGEPFYGHDLDGYMGEEGY